MSRNDKLFKMKGKSFKEYLGEQEKIRPGLKAELARLRRWAKFYELNPQFCPHNGIVAPISEDGKEQPGVCLSCGRENVMSTGADIPDGEPFTIKMTSTAHTITTQAKFA